MGRSSGRPFFFAWGPTSLVVTETARDHAKLLSVGGNLWIAG